MVISDNKNQHYETTLTFSYHFGLGEIYRNRRYVQLERTLQLLTPT